MSRVSTIVPYYGTTKPRIGARRVRASIMRVGRSFPSRIRTTVARGYTRRSGWYGRYNMGRDSAGELKFLDRATNDAVVANTGTFIDSMNLILQGATEIQRIGRKATIRDIDWRYTITLPLQDGVGTPIVGDQCRLILYQDKQTNGAAPAVLDILETVLGVKSFYQLQNKGRFNILMDRTHNINYLTMASTGAGVTDQGQVTQFHTFKKRCSIPIEFSGATGAVTEMRTNNIGMLAISEAGICGLNGDLRIRFSDG